MNQIKIGKCIATQRQKHGLRQKQLADQRHLSPMTISKWENGRGLPQIDVMLPLCEILQIQMAELLNGESVPGPESMTEIIKESLVTIQKKNETIYLLILVFGLFICMSGLILFPPELSGSAIFTGIPSKSSLPVFACSLF